MVICDRLRALREEKNLSQGDIEKRTGLLRSYISRVENGHTGPSTAKGPWLRGSAVLSKVCWLPTGSERRQTCPRPELDECQTTEGSRSQ
jgi:transcriptional regulator with XRE-family HTH domain